MEPNEGVTPKNNNLAAVIVGVIIAALVSGGVVYAYQNSQQTKSQQDLQAQIDALKSQLASAQRSTASPSPIASASPTPLVSPSASATPDPTANWKVYSDTSSGLSFKYPTTWTKYAGNGNYSPLILNSPTADSTGKHLNLTFAFGGTPEKPAITADTPHSAYVANVMPISISGSDKPYYVVAAGNTMGTVSDVFLSTVNYPLGKVSNLVTTVTTPKGVTTTFKTELLPLQAQNNPGFAYASYTSHADYSDLILIFKSLSD